MWIFPHRILESIHLLPALSPLMRIALLCTHVHDLKVITPLLGIFLLVLDTVSLNGPLSGTLPFHDTSTLVGCENDNILATAAEYGRPSIHTM